MSTLDRRSLLLTFSGSLLATACRTVTGSKLLDGASNSSAPVVRHRWVPGEKAEYKDKFIKAVTLLKANNDATVKDPRYFLSWNGIVKIHEKSCQHKNWFLLPYHRLYLMYFEAACQTVLEDPAFAVPYWDWSLDPKVPDEFFDVEVLQSPRAMKKGDSLPEDILNRENIEKLLGANKFQDFSSYEPKFSPMGGRSALEEGAFESGPHDTVHNSVGGKMADPKGSPVDPIFWLHHGNVDRLWGIWIAHRPELILPQLGLTENDKTQDPFKKLAWGEMTVRLDMNSSLPIGLEQYKESWPEALIAQGAVPRELLTADTVALFNAKMMANPPPPVKEGKNNRSAGTSMLVKDMIDAGRLPYFYDSDAQEAVTGPSISAMAMQKAGKEAPRTETLVTGTTSVKPDRLTTTIKLDADLIRKISKGLQGASENSASFQFYNMPIPKDADVRANLLMYYFIVDAAKLNQFPRKLSAKPYKMPEFVGAQSFFLTDHEHGPISKDHSKVSGSVNISVWLSNYLKAQGSVGELALLAIPANPKKNYEPVPSFSEGDKTELALTLSLSNG